MSTSDTGTPQPAAKPPLGWGAWLIVVLVVGAITAAVTVLAIRYFTTCGDCRPGPTQRSVQVYPSS